MNALAVDRPGLESELARAHGAAALVVHHFATWCDPCAEELPLLEPELVAAAALGATRVAIAWDRFMPDGDVAATLAACRAFLASRGATFDLLLVFTGTPPELFASQRIEHGTVPCTEVRARGGRVVATFPQPLFEAEDRARLASAVREACGAPK